MSFLPHYRDEKVALRPALQSEQPLLPPALSCDEVPKDSCVQGVWERRDKTKRKSLGTIPHEDDLDFTQLLARVVFAFQQAIRKGKPYIKQRKNFSASGND